MEQVIIEGTKYSPKVEFDPTGKLSIEGRSIIEDPGIFYNPIIEWINNCKSGTISVKMKIEYMNTSSTKLILNLFKAVKDNFNSNNVDIKWYYEEDDEEMLEIGKDFESMIHIPIDFYAYSA